MQMLKVFFDANKRKINADIIEISKDRISKDMSSYLEEFREYIGCRMIDVAYINHDVCVVVDDEGLLKSENPVIGISAEDGRQLQLAGILLIGGNKMTDEGDEIDTLSIDRCLDVLNKSSRRHVSVPSSHITVHTEPYTAIQ